MVDKVLSSFLEINDCSFVGMRDVGDNLRETWLKNLLGGGKGEEIGYLWGGEKGK